MKPPLDGRLVLIVEDELLIAIDLQTALEAHGAKTIAAHSLAQALAAVEAPSIDAAIVDHALGDGDSSELCRRLNEREIPFLCSSAHPHITGPCAGAKNLDKPVQPEVLIAAIQELFG